MSELFNALQKLEEKNAPDSTPAPPPVSGNENVKRKRVPYMRALLLLLIVLLVTGLSLAFLWFQPDLPFIAKDIQQAAVVPEEVLPESAEDLPEEVPDQAVGTENVPVAEGTPVVLEKEAHETGGTLKVSALQNVERTVTTAIKEKKEPAEQEQRIETLNREFNGGTRQLQSVDKFHDIERERNMVQRKRLVYRAENLRVQGDVAAALELYRQAWSILPNPALANNMAAILIGTEHYSKAETYLQKGLQLAPEDDDLLYNLEIAREGKRQKELQK